MSLERLQAMAKMLIEARDRVSRANAELTEAKRELLRLEREDMPELMREIGVELVGVDGQVVRLEEKVDARITDERRAAAHRWLLDNGHGDLIKTEIKMAFPRGAIEQAAAVAAQLAEEHDNVEVRETVHPQTLLAFVREQLRAGAAIPLDTFGVQPYDVVTVE